MNHILCTASVLLAVRCATPASTDREWTLSRAQVGYTSNLGRLSRDCRDYGAAVVHRYRFIVGQGIERRGGEAPGEYLRTSEIQYLFAGKRFRIERKIQKRVPPEVAKSPDFLAQKHDVRACDGARVQFLAWMPKGVDASIEAYSQAVERSAACDRRLGLLVESMLSKSEFGSSFFDATYSWVIRDKERPSLCGIERRFPDSRMEVVGSKVVRERVWFSADRGWVLQRAEGYDDQGRMVYEYRADDLRRQGTAWLPYKARLAEYAYVDGARILATEKTAELRRLELGQEANAGAFRIVFPAGTKVVDDIAGQVYVVAQAPRL